MCLRALLFFGPCHNTINNVIITMRMDTASGFVVGGPMGDNSASSPTGPRKRQISTFTSSSPARATTNGRYVSSRSTNQWKPRRIKKRYPSSAYWRRLLRQRTVLFWGMLTGALSFMLLVFILLWGSKGSNTSAPSSNTNGSHNKNELLASSQQQHQHTTKNLLESFSSKHLSSSLRKRLQQKEPKSATASYHNHREPNAFEIIFGSSRITSRENTPRQPPILPGVGHRDHEESDADGEEEEEEYSESESGDEHQHQFRDHLYHHHHHHQKQQNHPDYGGLELNYELEGADQPIEILYESYSDMLNAEADEAEEEDDPMGDVDEDYVGYYAFDDDYLRGRRVAHDGVNSSEDDETPSQCRRVAEHRSAFPSCNDFHQLDYAGIGQVSNTDFTFINYGTFREVFSFQAPKEKVAIKEIRYDKSDADTELFEYVRVDALVAERLSSNPRTFDIYGFCGLSILSEFFYHGDIEDRAMLDEEELYADETFDTVFTPEQKLVLALEMAQGLAFLHGYEHGMILHSDVQMGQFLMNQNKTMLKLNDFNRAEFLLWDEGHQSYCQHRNGKGHGNWRSPEEYRNDALTDKIDVWSLGNNMYALLTGVEPMLPPPVKGRPPRASGKTLTDRQIVEGKTGYIDPKYLLNKSEGVLATIIQRCYEYEPANRPTMFGIVEELSKAVSEMEQEKGVTRQVILQQL